MSWPGAVSPQLDIRPACFVGVLLRLMKSWRGTGDSSILCIPNFICSGIEVVITGLTRNQFAGNRT